MFNNKLAVSALLFLFLSMPFAQAADTITPTATKETKVIQTEGALQTTALKLVASPNSYIHKKITINAKFDKFSTLGLDYKKALRDSQKYIGFLIQRDDVKDHNIPLSELKLFMTRTYAEKFIDLNTGDKIKITGTVFSTALDDPWVDVEEIKIIEKAPSTKTK